MKILIMGLPGSGKTTLAEKIIHGLKESGMQVNWHNADSIRQKWKDWDFTMSGRLRQAERMAMTCDEDERSGFHSVCDFVCPTVETRKVFNNDRRADLIIWMDTIEAGRFDDTNKLFEIPSEKEYDVRVRTFNDDSHWMILDMILNHRKPIIWDDQRPTVQMLGRWQPWHEGHRALFERALAKTGQVCIMIRDCQGWNDSNPFDVRMVERNIHADLEGKYYGQYKVIVVPNIINITYGRDVGYRIEQETFDESVESISATKIRKSMGV
jgi:nucleoside-triphosphatase THEP1